MLEHTLDLPSFHLFWREAQYRWQQSTDVKNSRADPLRNSYVPLSKVEPPEVPAYYLLYESGKELDLYYVDIIIYIILYVKGYRPCGAWLALEKLNKCYLVLKSGL